MRMLLRIEKRSVIRTGYVVDFPGTPNVMILINDTEVFNWSYSSHTNTCIPSSQTPIVTFVLIRIIKNAKRSSTKMMKSIRVYILTASGLVI